MPPESSSPATFPGHTPSPPTGWPQELVKYLNIEDSPGSALYFSISSLGLIATANLLGCSIRAAMVFCLKNDIWPLRFKNNRGFFTNTQQATLLDKRAAIIGCGGLGGYAALFLARAGVGALSLCDFDIFAESNLNRQAFCREDRLGMNKALAGKEDLALVASHVIVDVFTQKAEPTTLPHILKGSDIAVDCLDDICSRRHLEHAAHEMGIPFAHSAIAGCEAFALASFPGEIRAIERLYGKGDIAKSSTAEYRLGVPTPTPAAAALMECMLVLRILTGMPVAPANSLWHLDLSLPELEILHY